MTPHTSPIEPWSRRTFLLRSALTTAAASLPNSTAFAFGHASRTVTVTEHHASPGKAPQGLALTSGRERLVLATTLVPRALAVHPVLPVVYTAFSGTDLASLAAHRVQAHPLSVTVLTAAQPVALAASRPCSLAVTPHGESLLTLDRSGLLTLHTLHADGSIGPLQHVRRLTGSPHLPGSLPRPTHLTVDRKSGTAFITDPPCRRIVPVDLAAADGPALLPDLPFTPGPQTRHDPLTATLIV